MKEQTSKRYWRKKGFFYAKDRLLMDAKAAVTCLALVFLLTLLCFLLARLSRMPFPMSWTMESLDNAIAVAETSYRNDPSLQNARLLGYLGIAREKGWAPNVYVTLGIDGVFSERLLGREQISTYLCLLPCFHFYFYFHLNRVLVFGEEARGGEKNVAEAEANLSQFRLGKMLFCNVTGLIVTVLCALLSFAFSTPSGVIASSEDGAQLVSAWRGYLPLLGEQTLAMVSACLLASFLASCQKKDLPAETLGVLVTLLLCLLYANLFYSGQPSAERVCGEDFLLGSGMAAQFEAKPWWTAFIRVAEALCIIAICLFLLRKKRRAEAKPSNL